MAALALVLCLAVSLLGWREPRLEQAHTRRAPGVSAQRSQATGASLAASRHGSVSRGMTQGAASGPPPRLSVVAQEGGRPWVAPCPGVRAWQDAFSARVAVHVQRLRPGLASHVGHACADQPPVVTRPLRGPPPAPAG
jgi:hypothetical protein